ncbi:unnamed protein product [Plutella xylostella]|uniref:(diamondback moth) hypothetical protein n=1 Tax=Plutella xylostella TaxID=51655 RepID=A0A8S4D5J3_PLUXY|nr:unnamed protein product [Plutella xylostella]
MKQNNKTKPLVIIQCYEDRQQTLPLWKTENGTSGVITNGTGISNGHQKPSPKRDAPDHPPPPPPMPATNGHHNGDVKKTISQVQEKINSDLTNGSSPRNGIRNGSISRTPTPDYNKPEALSQVKLRNGSREENADMESLESFKLRAPAAVAVKPPSTYFVRAPNGTATMKKSGRPVSVTIGEYGAGGVRRQPSRLDFLPDQLDAPLNTDDVSNRLQSELALTLSRSNLRKKTEALIDG